MLDPVIGQEDNLTSNLILPSQTSLNHTDECKNQWIKDQDQGLVIDEDFGP